MCVRFFFQPSLVSTGNVIERFLFVNFLQFLGRAFWIFFIVGAIFDARCEKFVGFVIAGFLNRVRCAIFSRTPSLRCFPL